MLLEMALTKVAVVMVQGGFSTMISTEFPHSMFFWGFHSPTKPNQLENAGTKMPWDQDFSKIWGFGPPQPITL